MRLPDLDTILLPDDGEWMVVDDSDPPAPSLADVQALLPAFARRDVMPLRDAMLEAWGDIANTLWAAISRLMESQQSPRFADESWLAWWGDLTKTPRADDESVEEYRERLLASRALVSPDALRAGVEALVDRFTATPPAFAEACHDSIFCGNAAGAASTTQNATVKAAGVRSWSAYIQPSQTTTQNASVSQRSGRLWGTGYGHPRGADSTPGAYLLPMNLPVFLVAVPEAGGNFVDGAVASGRTGQTTTHQTVVQGSPTSDDYFSFCGNAGVASTTQNISVAQAGSAAWSWYVEASASGLPQLVVMDVESRRGAGVVWICLTDEKLENAR